MTYMFDFFSDQGLVAPAWEPRGPVIPVRAEVSLYAPESYEVDQIGGCLNVLSKWPYNATYKLKLDALDLGTGQMQRMDFRTVMRDPVESQITYARTPTQMGDISHLRYLRDKINEILGDAK